MSAKEIVDVETVSPGVVSTFKRDRPPRLSITRNARQHLGEVIAYYIERRGWPHRKVAKVTGTNERTVEAWIRGEAIPTSDEWRGLKAAVSHELAGYAELRQVAADEQYAANDEAKKRRIEEHEAKLREQREKENAVTTTNKPGAPIVSLGDKLRVVQPQQPASSAPTAPPAAPPDDGGSATQRVRRMIVERSLKEVTVDDVAATLHLSHEKARNVVNWLATRGELRPTQTGFAVERVDATVAGRPGYKFPPNSRSREAVEQRIQFARAVFMQRPYVTIGGKDGLHEMLRQRFGVSLDAPTLANLRNEVLTSAGKAPVTMTRGGNPRTADGESSITAARHQTMAEIPDATTTVSVHDILAEAERNVREREEAAAAKLAVAVTPPTPTDPTADVQAAVELILGALLMLRSFSITVDDAGEAHVDYKVREVKVVEASGSLRMSTRKDK